MNSNSNEWRTLEDRIHSVNELITLGMDDAAIVDEVGCTMGLVKAVRASRTPVSEQTKDPRTLLNE